jgi:hypothetical protein
LYEHRFLASFEPCHRVARKAAFGVPARIPFLAFVLPHPHIALLCAFTVCNNDALM